MQFMLTGADTSQYGNAVVWLCRTYSDEQNTAAKHHCMLFALSDLAELHCVPYQQGVHLQHKHSRDRYLGPDNRF